MFARNVLFVDDLQSVLCDPSRIDEMRTSLRQGDVSIIKQVYPKDLILKIRSYLENIGRNSLPNYRSIEPGCPNFHRINYKDERAHVRGCFHQFSFFPWNQDVFDLFRLFRDVYYLKNELCGSRGDKFLDREPEDGCIARLSFQFYPAGAGSLNCHTDPVDHHQLGVPTLTMSKKGLDYGCGGAYLITANETRIYTDEISEIGDVVLFDGSIAHGVDVVDPHEEVDWPAMNGRWVMLFATNKLHSNTSVTDAVEVEAFQPA